MWEKIKAFLGITPPKTDMADAIRKEAFEKERVRLAAIEGKKEAELLSKKRLEQFESKQKQEIKQAKQPFQKSNWQNQLQSISDAIDSTFKPSTKQKFKKPEGDGVSPTFSIYKETPSKKYEF